MSRKKMRSISAQIRVDQQNSYDESHTKQIKLKLNLKTDADILDWLHEKQSWKSGTSMQGEIKRLIREEIARDTMENGRCTPTKNGSLSSDAVQNESLMKWKYLSRPDVQEYLQMYPDVTDEEKEALENWLAEGYSYLENADFLADEHGRTMDFIQGERASEDLREAMMCQ